MYAISRYRLWIWNPHGGKEGSVYSWPQGCPIAALINGHSLLTAYDETMTSIGAGQDRCAVGTNHGLVVLLRASQGSAPQFLNSTRLPPLGHDIENIATSIYLDHHFLAICTPKGVCLYDLMCDELRLASTVIVERPLRAEDARIVEEQGKLYLVVGVIIHPDGKDKSKHDRPSDYVIKREEDEDKDQENEYITPSYIIVGEIKKDRRQIKRKWLFRVPTEYSDSPTSVTSISTPGQVRFVVSDCGYLVVGGHSGKSLGDPYVACAGTVGPECLFTFPSDHSLLSVMMITREG